MLFLAAFSSTASELPVFVVRWWARRLKVPLCFGYVTVLWHTLRFRVCSVQLQVTDCKLFLVMSVECFRWNLKISDIPVWKEKWLNFVFFLHAVPAQPKKQNICLFLSSQCGCLPKRDCLWPKQLQDPSLLSFLFTQKLSLVIAHKDGQVWSTSRKLHVHSFRR